MKSCATSLGRSALALALGLAAAAAAAATLPDWVAAAVASKDSAAGVRASRAVAGGGGAAMELFRSTAVRFTPGDRAQIRRRVVLWVSAEAARAIPPAAESYNPDTERIVSARAWTVSTDGKRIRSYGRSDFIDGAGRFNGYVWSQRRAIVFSAADKVDLGGIIACEIEIDAEPGVFAKSCDFENRFYLLHGEFEAVPAPGTTLIWHASSHRLATPTSGPDGSLRWVVDRLAPFGQGRPSGFLANPLEVSVRCAPIAAGAAFARDWGEQAGVVAGFFDPSRDDNAVIRAEAARLTAGKTGRWEKIRALTEFVQREIVYLEVTLDKDNLAGYRPHHATVVLHERYGDCKDKATLLVALLRAEGEDAHAVLLYAGNPSVVAADWPDLDFNHAIVAIPSAGTAPADWPLVGTAHLGQMVIFDPTDPVTPLGVLSPSDQGGYGLIIDPKNGELAKLPTAALAASDLKRTIRASYRPGGQVEAEVEEDRRGVTASQIYGRRFMGGMKNFTRELEARIHQAAPLAEDLKWTEKWDAVDARYRLDFHFETGGFIRPIGDDSEMITPQLLPVGNALNPWTSRAEGVAWLPPDAITEETILPIPDGYKVDEVPDPWKQTSGTAACAVSYRTEGRTIVYRTEVSRPGGFFKKADYETLRTFYRKLHDAQRRPIVFRRVS